MRLVFFGILVAIALIIIIQLIQNAATKKKCTAEAIGRFMYSDCVDSPNPQRLMRSLWIPVYEFSVGDTMYLVRSGKNGPGEKSFPAETKVIYDPNDPYTCFVLDVRGKVISKYGSDVASKPDSGNEIHEKKSRDHDEADIMNF